MIGAARLFDPDTAQQAAARQRGGAEAEILSVHGAHPWGLTDDECCDLLAGWHAPTIKSARSRLAKQGRLEDSGARRPSATCSPMIVWVLTR